MSDRAPENQTPSLPVTEELPLVSVVIPMLNEAANIRRCVESILEQTYPTDRLEVVVVDGISEDGSRDILAELSATYDNVSFYDNPLRVTPRALNIGIQNARGEVIIILGAHTKINPDFIERNIHYMLTRGEVCTGGTQINVGDTWLQQAIGVGMASKFGIPTAPYRYETKPRYVDTVVYAAYRRELLQEVGLFDEDLHIAEDAELNWRIRQAGHKIFFSPEIVSYYYPRPTLGKLFKQFFNYGLMRINVVKKHADAFKLLHLVPALAVLGGITLAALSFVNIIFLYVLLAAAGLYGAGILLGAVIEAKRTRWSYLPALPLVFFTLHAGFGIGFIIGLFKSQKWGVAIPRWAEKLLLFISDYVAVNLAFYIWAGLRYELNLPDMPEPASIFKISNIIFVFWFFVFLFFGLYREWQAQSRLDEFIQVVKAVFWGVMVIFLVTFDLNNDLSNPLPLSRMLIVTYLGLMAGFVGLGRILLHTFQRKLLELGIGMRRALIVGWGKQAHELFEKVSRYPALGYRVAGFISPEQTNGRTDYRGVPLLGSVADLAEQIEKNKAEEILIALENNDRTQLFEVISATDGLPVRLKIVPDLYSIITGQARTNQIYGFPLIEILPQLMPDWEKQTKRLIDIIVSSIILLAGTPLWLLVALIIKLDSRGPVLYAQERVGFNGKLFNIYKFRSMVHDAEKSTGPTWAAEDDPRITRVGKWIRKLRIDEVPQFYNVLKGEMSLVGPRPERPYFVEKLKKELPLYSRRLKVRPGITGWAQIKGKYDTTLDDVRQKLQYDLFYLENMSLRMDLKILINTIYVIFSGKGH